MAGGKIQERRVGRRDVDDGLFGDQVRFGDPSLVRDLDQFWKWK